MFPEERLDLVVRYAARLATDGVVRGLIGPREAPRLWERHLINCGLLAPALPTGAAVADVGSGAGLPGLVLALARPDAHITLIEPLLRRTTFLEEVVDELGLDNVTVTRGRADALHGKAWFDVVTARAVAPLDGLVSWCMPLVAPEGALLAMKGASAEAEIAAASSYCQKLGCAAPSIEVLGAGLDPELAVDPIRVVRVTWADPARVSLPPSRKGGVTRASRPGGSRNKRRKS
ncbi:16S rRNA (guanine(527)-N(7))-methyltransferase RsmG [Nocardioides sp.]|nr:16S rRNA (guanine(527)-N(7))-methyltransferase RsmG [Nocardioides sp.]THI96802.1 16S rRNA (guanine(527)-N(7))-methyltransferase RsmG [Nocardioides sp.]